MRIAVSGTHCCGKTTLIERFLSAHSEFVYEPEPYIVLEEEYGESFSAEPSADEFYRQLEFSIERLQNHAPGENVIYERSPVDFVAYLLALNDLGRDTGALRMAEQSLSAVSDAIRMLDLIVLLSLDDAIGISAPESEDLELRETVDSRLVEILRDDIFDLFSPGPPAVVEPTGSTAQRLTLIEGILKRNQN